MTDCSRISTATLAWDDHGQPQSQQFGDVYFSRNNGLAESEYVFLQQNQLAERWQKLSCQQHFVIAETGFGSGLNFLAAWRLWRKLAPPQAQLHFMSVEYFPMARQDLQRALGLWPELAELSTQLVSSYPIALRSGVHRLRFDNVHLTLILDDAVSGLNQMLASEHCQFRKGFANFSVDAWFLDGFAPAKNPQMWQPELFELMARLSKKSTTVATFTSAGIVKRGLAGNGFAVSKVPGYGSKREMLMAQCLSTVPEQSYSVQKTAPPAWMVNLNPPPMPGPIAVVGAGLAGAHTARVLAERGIEVHLFDRQPCAANEASGNPQGVIYAKLAPQASSQGDFNCLALLFAERFYRQYCTGHNAIGARCGVLQLAMTTAEAANYKNIASTMAAPDLVRWVEQSEATQLAGCETSQPGLYFPQSGWISPRDLCHRLLQHGNISSHFATEVIGLTATDYGWQITSSNADSTGLFQAIVIANANDCRKLLQCSHLPVKPVRGQISILPANPVSQQLQCVVCGDGYTAPAHAGIHCIGATFDPKNIDLTPRHADQLANIEATNSVLPTLGEIWQSGSDHAGASRVALRATSPDYLPLVGPVAEVSVMDERFHVWRKNARTRVDAPGAYLPGLFVNVGHGSRGLTYTPLCAELIAAHILGEPSPVGRDLVQALHPARFLIRDLIRNRR